MKTITVNGMHCQHCKAAVEQAAAAVPGVLNPTVNLEAKELSFEEQQPVNMEELKKAIENCGFDPV